MATTISCMMSIGWDSQSFWLERSEQSSSL
jgi:hypothetical protein